MTVRYRRADGPVRQYPRGRVWKIRTGMFAGMWAASLVGTDTDRLYTAGDQPTALRYACELLQRHHNQRRLAAGVPRIHLTSPDIRPVGAPVRVLSDADHAALINQANPQGARRV